MRLLFTLLLSVSLLFSGCTWLGTTTGKAKAKIEKSADDFSDGYDRGYEEEQSK